jgi:hypothetical protein
MTVILYFSILLHCIVQWVLQVCLFVRQTTTIKSKQTNTYARKHKKKTQRKTAQEQNTNGKHAECDHVKKGSEPKKQRNKILKHLKINI